MKRTALVIIVAVMIATPCFAQEVEPEGIISLHGTAWKVLVESCIFPFPGIGRIGDEEPDLGFYNDKLYRIQEYGVSYIENNSIYIDMIAFSIFTSNPPFRRNSSITTHLTAGVPSYDFGILLPIGIGMRITWACTWYRHPLLPFIDIELLSKTEDNWIPQPRAEISIFPNQGEQGTSLTDVQITFFNTTVSHVHHMCFYSYDSTNGVDFNNWIVISDTQVECDITIPDDEPIGFRQIEIFFDEDDGSYRQLHMDHVFEVIEKPF